MTDPIDQPQPEPEPEPADEPAAAPQAETTRHDNGEILDSPTVNAEVVGVTILTEGEAPPEPEPEPEG